ncbi:GAF domain-containing protein [Demequina activiva]|uniref:GAF domain-containing protein n=1 Tax=Demequina activiva TaxID=1582364 RepID=A0A919PZU8_9MICO|nr:GAF domain-containing protein [Demequina activiva]GIG53386.1 hypothetical protein Dac01nite_01380 [Demequina activiva]
MTSPTSPGVYRAPMRSRDDDVPDGPAVDRALSLGLCGLGGRLEGSPDALEDAVSLARRQHGDRLAQRIGRFAAVPDGTEVWTRDVDGLYWRGELAGPWHYDARPDAAAVDLVHVRTCRWADSPLEEPSVPDAVRASFARGGRNWQRIRAATPR